MKTAFALPLLFAAPCWWYLNLPATGAITLLSEHEFDENPYKNRLLFAGDKGLQTISIPLQKETRKGPYDAVRISYAERWQNKMLNALRTCYGKSPFYEYYDYMLEPVILHPYEHLWELNTDILKFTLKCLKYGTESIPTTAYTSAPTDETAASGFRYYQTFASKSGFIENLSILDLLFHEGPDARFLLDEFRNRTGL